jgi:MbtH protein
VILDSEDSVFNVVINDELQYSIWPENLLLPAGWKLAGKSGSKSDCLEFVEANWTDMRPLSLRNLLDGAAAER